MDSLSLRQSHEVIDGQFVNAKVERIVLAIKDYEPLIDVVWLPVGARINENGDRLPAFKLIYRDPNGPDFTLFHVKDEDEFDERVLMRIIQNDQRKNPVGLSDLETFDRAQELMAKQAYLDQIEEANDIAFHVLRTKKNTYKVSDDLVIKEGMRGNQAHANKKIILTGQGKRAR